jgi:hypothetical protein
VLCCASFHFTVFVGSERVASEGAKPVQLFWCSVLSVACAREFLLRGSSELISFSVRLGSFPFFFCSPPVRSGRVRSNSSILGAEGLFPVCRFSAREAPGHATRFLVLVPDFPCRQLGFSSPVISLGLNS